VLVGWRRVTGLPVQQYPKLDSASVIITTAYVGAGADTVRGFLTTPIERAVSAISGVDHIESTSRAGVSTVTIRLELGYDTTQGARRGHRAPAAGALRTAGRG
jgi:multidrug efflux pump